MTTPPDDDSPTATTEAVADAPSRGLNRWLTRGLLPVVIVVLLVGAVVAGAGTLSKTPTVWSAVFLTDNEVFFGHVKRITADDVQLVNVYYVQSSQSTQTGAAPASTQLAVLGLVGTQVQCPTDELTINRKSVLDIQELQPKSFVVSRLATLSKASQNCFQPAAAPAATAAAPQPGASAAATTPSPSR